MLLNSGFASFIIPSYIITFPGAAFQLQEGRSNGFDFIGLPRGYTMGGIILVLILHIPIVYVNVVHVEKNSQRYGMQPEPAVISRDRL